MESATGVSLSPLPPRQQPLAPTRSPETGASCQYRKHEVRIVPFVAITAKLEPAQRENPHRAARDPQPLCPLLSKLSCVREEQDTWEHVRFTAEAAAKTVRPPLYCVRRWRLLLSTLQLHRTGRGGSLGPTCWKRSRGGEGSQGEEAYIFAGSRRPASREEQVFPFHLGCQASFQQ